jgi:hypothetical protein
MTLYYVPLEPIKGRYSEQWARPITGWLERNWIKAGIDYKRIDGPEPFADHGVGVGKVLNPVRRSEWGFAQSLKIVQMIVDHTIKPDDCIWFDDFWHPGLEMIGQVRDQVQHGHQTQLYSFCHAQSVDRFDFMHDSRKWARPIEEGYMSLYDVVFVNNDYLKELLDVAFQTVPHKVENCGHVFCSEEVKEIGSCSWGYPKEDLVIFTSRFDKEKQPHLFMDMVEGMGSHPDCQFAICCGGQLRSDDASSLLRARRMESKGKLCIYENLSKAQYYHMLAKAKVQFSSSLQDWVSYCLLEAVTFSCYPAYPNFRSFPEAFGREASILYPFHPSMSREEKAMHAVMCVEKGLEEYDRLNHEASFSNIVKRHDTTWRRQLDIMGL